MTKRIWKQELRAQDEQRVNLPHMCKILCVQTQYDVPCIWFECDDQAPKKERVFHIYGTGHSMPENPGVYIGTFQIAVGMSLLVFHLYDPHGE